MFQRLRDSTEAVKLARPARINLPTLLTRVTAEQATLALTAATADIVTTVLLTLQPQPDITEAARTALPAPTNPQILLIRVTAEQPTPALTAATAVTAITARHM